MASNMPRKKIATLVFLDLETTGLPQTHPHITEISLVAVERHSLLAAGYEPRVLNKLVLTIDPGKEVEPVAEQLTGLTRDLLKTFPGFDNNTASILKLFLDRLPIPICLIAHNGFNFDFRLLNSELSTLKDLSFGKFLCIDTMNALKSLDNDGLLIDPKSIAKKIKKKVAQGKDQAARLLQIGMKRSYSESNGLIVESPDIAKSLQVSGVIPKKKTKRTIMSYKLSTIYKYFFKKDAENCHSAEGDCMALLKVCHVNSFHFLSYIDENAIPLENISVMW